MEQKVVSNSLQCLLFTVLAVSLLPASLCKPHQSDGDETSILWTALCVHDNHIRDACLHNVHTKAMVEDVLLSLSPLTIGRSKEEDEDEEETPKMKSPSKRGRQENSGFYSNW